MSQVYISILFVLYSGCTFQSEATRCFECTGVPYPRDCTKIITCDADEVCSTEQIVTTSGHIVYNTGCLMKDRCTLFPNGALLGKRDLNITARGSSDISTCIECCSGNFCNNKGCGTQTTPFGQRGPYCYNCDAVLDPLACNHVSVCQTHEDCVLYSPLEYNGLPETVYRSQCEPKVVCDMMTQAHINYRCPPLCCGTDFCNVHCGTASNSSMSTPVPHSTVQPVPTHPETVATTTHLIVTNHPVAITTTHRAMSSPTNTNSSTSQSHCEQGGYTYLQNNNAQLCVYISTGHGQNWKNAQSHCDKEHHGRLVVLDTHDKALLMRQKLQSDFSDSKGYWIGAGDTHSHGLLPWVNGNHLIDHDTDWDIGQPIRTVDGKHYDCVAMLRASTEPFKWHAYYCADDLAYICEHS